MENDRVRPEWQGFMLFFLRWVFCPLVKGAIPSPIITFDDPGVRDRFLKFAPDSKPLVEAGRCSAVALMDNVFRIEFPVDAVVKWYQNSSCVRASRRRHTFSKNDIQGWLNIGTSILEGVPVNQKWAFLNSVNGDDEVVNWFKWFLGINFVCFYECGIPFPLLLYVSREAPSPVSETALVQAIALDKSVLGLTWVIRRIERAAAGNDQTFLRKIGKALTTAPVPMKLRAEALNVFLCVFQPWLKNLRLREQASLLREGGLEVSEKGLRSRRNRLGLTKLRPTNEEQPTQEFQMWLQQTRRILEKGPGAKDYGMPSRPNIH